MSATEVSAAAVQLNTTKNVHNIILASFDISLYNDI